MKNMYVFYFAIFIPAALIIYKIFKNLLVSDDDEEDNDGKDSKDN